MLANRSAFEFALSVARGGCDREALRRSYASLRREGLPHRRERFLAGFSIPLDVGASWGACQVTPMLPDVRAAQLYFGEPAVALLGFGDFAHDVFFDPPLDMGAQPLDLTSDPRTTGFLFREPPYVIMARPRGDDWNAPRVLVGALLLTPLT